MQRYDSDLPAIEELIELSGRDALEIGCGDGRITSALCSRVRSLVALDPELEKVRRAAERVPGARFMVGGGEELGFADGSFDLVLFGYSLHHHRDGKRALLEARRVLRKNGKLLIIEPCVDGEYTQWFALFDPEEIVRLESTAVLINANDFQVAKALEYLVHYSYSDEGELRDELVEAYGIERVNELFHELKSRYFDATRDGEITVEDRVRVFLMSW